MDGDGMRHGEVYKKKSSWWYTKQTEGSPLRLSTKHKTKAKAFAVAEQELNEGRIDNLHTWKGNGSYESCMAICKSKENHNEL